SREYVFLAFEGGWQNSAKQSGFSYHLATDHELMTVELPVELDLSLDREIQLVFDVDKILSGARTVQLTDATDTTHSRTNDALATELRGNVERAFGVGNTRTEVRAPGRGVYAASGSESAKPLIAPNATPYRLTISKFFPRPELPR